MITSFVEAVSDAGNWGKFQVSVWDDDEWARRSTVSGCSLLNEVGWRADDYILVLDLQTAEGAVFRLGGMASADLNKHRVWVCVLFEPFLTWLYDQWNRRDSNVSTAEWVQALPPQVRLTGIPLEMAGYRRPGPATDHTG